jgi:cation diffusion facilitator family transporter
MAANQQTGESEGQRGQRRTALTSIMAAALLVTLKLGTGLISGSLGLVSAGIESSGDVVAAVLTFFAIRLGGRPADENHPYGHRRAENLAALGEAAILIAGGVVVTVEAIGRLAGSEPPPETGWFVFAVIGVVLLVDISRTTISLRTAKKYRSAALRSNAFHFAGDMAGSLAVLAGLLAVKAGVDQGDAVAAVVVAAIIFVAAARLIYENARVLMDTAPADAASKAGRAIAGLGDAVEVRRLRVRESGGSYFVDAVVGVPPGQAVVEGHLTADEIESAVREALPDSDVVVHLEPQQEGLGLRDRALAIALAEPLVREAHDITIYEHGGHRSVSLHLKFYPQVTLRQAHEVAERVEANLGADPDVDHVWTHLEPLERPIPTTERWEETAIEGEQERVRRLVHEVTGREPNEVRLLSTPVGVVIFLSVQAGAEATLETAHQLASRLEDEIRQGQSHIADVVVHTEPWAGTAS